MHDDEATLAARALTGDQRAFDTLYDLAFRLAFAFAWHQTRRREVAEEVTTETLRRAFAALSGYSGEKSFGSWLLGIEAEVLAKREAQKARTR